MDLLAHEQGARVGSSQLVHKVLPQPTNELKHESQVQATFEPRQFRRRVRRAHTCKHMGCGQARRGLPIERTGGELGGAVDGVLLGESAHHCGGEEDE